MGPQWRREPFRLFFPLGVILGWVGIGHWLLYSIGITATYSCQLHGLLQTQAFLMAFAVGFLMTALPRRTQTDPPSATEMWIAAAALATTTVATTAERWTVAEAGYVTLLFLLLQFAVRRFPGRTSGRRPPAAFVLIPFAFLHGLGGAGFILAGSALGAPRREPEWPRRSPILASVEASTPRRGDPASGTACGLDAARRAVVRGLRVRSATRSFRRS